MFSQKISYVISLIPPFLQPFWNSEFYHGWIKSIFQLSFEILNCWNTFSVYGILVTEFPEALFVVLSIDTKLYFLELHISAVIITRVY